MKTSKQLPAGVDRLPSGKIRARYRCKGCPRHTEGGWHSRTYPASGGIRAAQAWLRTQQTSVDAGVHVPPTLRTTVAEYAAEWAAARPHRPASRRQVGTYLEHLSSTPLGARPLRLVKPTEVQAWVSGRSVSYAPQTVRNVATFVKAVFAGAVEDQLIARSPFTSKVVLPKVAKAEFVPLTVQQVRDLADAMEPRYAIGVTLQAACGLRISELLGLQVRDVDFLRRTVRVERQVGRNGVGFVEPKTVHSKRTIPLAASVVDVLAAHLAAYPPNTEGVIITTTWRNPVRQDIYGARFNVAVTTAGLAEQTTSHDLRHHFASALLRQGVPANVVAKYLGHSSAALVLSTYSHCMPDTEDLTRQALDALWSPFVSPAVSQGGLRGV